MLEVDESELALIQRQCERAHIEHPTAAMAMLMWPTRNPDPELPKIPPFDRNDGHLVNEYDHSLGYVQVHFFGSDDALALYTEIATAACVAMPGKTDARNWAEFLFEQRAFAGKPLTVSTGVRTCILLKTNPFLASALAIQQLMPSPPIDNEKLWRRSLEALHEKFERAADRSPKARHCAVVSDDEPTHREHGDYVFKTLDGRWWRCKADGVNMSEFGALCREAAHICEGDPRCALMPKPGRTLGHDDAWMMFVHRLAWQEPAGSSLRAFTEKEGGSEISPEIARREPAGLLSELRPNLYSACAMAIDVLLATPVQSPAQTPRGTSAAEDSVKTGWPPGAWRTAAWFRDVTSDLLLPAAMLQAGKRALIKRHRLKDGDDWRYEVSSVVKYWPERRAVIEQRVGAELG